MLKNDTVKLSFNKTKLTILWARKCANIQKVLISKFASSIDIVRGNWLVTLLESSVISYKLESFLTLWTRLENRLVFAITG